MLYQFTNLEPTHENNIIITYAKKLENFDFENIAAKSETYFSAIDQLSASNPNPAEFSSIQFDSPFDISEINAVSVIFFLVIYGIPLLFVLGLGFVVYWVIKRRRRGA